ncbi:MAG: MBL fold metallo-hydrolase [Acidimicrobiales bacterium]
MTVVTGVAQKQAWDSNAVPPVERVRPGVWSIPVPIPDNPLRYVLVYLFELDDGIALVDAGWNTEAAWSALNEGIAMAGGSMSDVRAVVVTHIHPDHYGLAGRIREACGAWIGLHPLDAALLKGRYLDMDELVERMSHLLRVSGVPEEKLPDLSRASMEIRAVVSMAEPDVLIEDGAKIEFPGWDLEAIWTPGHSPGHICLYSDRQEFLLSGDHVLPRITPNISFHTQQAGDPLGNYLESLTRVDALKVEEVFPAHEYRFSGHHERIAEIVRHHESRLDAIYEILTDRPGASVWEITTSLRWSRPWDEIPSFMQRAANGETLAHLVVLEARHRVERKDGIPALFFPVS